MGTYTTNYNLFMPTVGEQGWGELVNGNFTIIDAAMKSLSDNIGTLETEIGTIEEKVTTLEAGNFETVNVGSINATTGNLENLTSVKTSSLIVDYIATSQNTPNSISVTVSGASLNGIYISSGTLCGYDVPEFVGLVKLGECKNTFTVPVTVSGYAKAQDYAGSYNIFADGVNVGTLTFHANPNSSYTSTSVTVNVPIPTKALTYSYASGTAHSGNISASSATFYVMPYTP